MCNECNSHMINDYCLHQTLFLSVRVGSGDEITV